MLYKLNKKASAMLKLIFIIGLVILLNSNVNFVFIHKITHNPTKEHDAASKTQ